MIDTFLKEIPNNKKTNLKRIKVANKDITERGIFCLFAAANWICWIRGKTGLVYIAQIIYRYYFLCRKTFL